MNEKTLFTEEQAMEFFTFFIISARTQLDDPRHYASMRFLSAAEKVRDFISEHVSPETQKLLDDSFDKIDHAHIVMNDIPAYASVLDSLCAMVAQYQVEQHDLEERFS